MKKNFTLTAFVFLAVFFGFASKSFATHWTTSTVGAVTNLSNWTDGTSPPTTFATPGDTWTVTMNMTLGSGVTWALGTASSTPDTLIVSTGGTITMSGVSTTSAITVYGDMIMSGGTMSMGGTSASEIVNIYGDMFYNSGTSNTPASSAHLYFNTSGNCTMSGGAASTNGSSASIVFNTTGDFIMTGGTVSTNGSSAYVTVNTHGHFSMSGGSINSSAASALDTVNAFGTMTMSGGTISSGGASCKVITRAYGNCSISGSAAFTNTGAGCTNSLHFCYPRGSGAGMIDNTSTGTWSGTNVYVDANCEEQLDGNFSSTTGASTYGLTVNGILICPAAYNITGTGIFKLNASGALVVGHATGINGAILTTGTKTFNDTAGYGFNGTVAQVTGSYMPAVLYAPDTILIDNPAGVTLTQSTSTTGVLALVSGVLSTGADTMTVPGGAANVIAASSTSYVYGTFVKTITGYTTVNYEVGDMSYAPMQLTLSAAGTGGSLAVSCHNGLHPSIGSSGFSGTHIYNHYWTVGNMGAAGPATVTPMVTCLLADILGGSNGYFKTQQYAGSAWLGAPLATTNTISPYTSAPSSGINLAALDGDYIFGRTATTLVANNIASPGDVLSVFPNPASGTVSVTLKSAQNQVVNMVITNVAGQIVKEFTVMTNTPASVSLNVPGGVYLLSAQTSSGAYCTRIIVRADN